MRVLAASNQFRSKAHKFFKRHPDLEAKAGKLLTLLTKDVFHPQLKAHKLTGDLKKLYAASLDHRYRIVFGFNDETVFLINIGSHDEVY